MQRWVSQSSGSIRNAYLVNEPRLARERADKGIIEKLLWRIGYEPATDLSMATTLEVLAPTRLEREVQRQHRLEASSAKTHNKNFVAARTDWIGSVVPKDLPNRDKVVQDIVKWFDKTIPDMRQFKAVVEAAQSGYDAGNGLELRWPDIKVDPAELEGFVETNAGREYGGRVLCKPGEEICLENGILSVGKPVALMIE